MVRPKILGFLAWLIYRTLSLTWKVTIIEPENLKKRLNERLPCIFSHWHGDELVLVQLARSYRIGTLVSRSIDGEIMNTFLRLMGAWTVRGSSSRGGISALLQLIKQIRKCRMNSSFAVDGPKGPRHIVKPGIFHLQKNLYPLQIPIFAAGVAASSYWCFARSWNQAILPKPFARVIIYWLESQIQLKTKDDSHNPTFVDILTKELHSSQTAAEKSLKFLSQ